MSDPTAGAPSIELPRLPCSVSQRCDLLYKTEWSEGFDWSEVSILAEYVDAYHAPAGTTIFEQGEQGHYMCLLVEGEVDVMMADSSGVPKHLATIDEGKPFGGMSLIDGEPRSATAIARADCKVLTLSQAAFQQLTDEHPPLSVVLLKKLAVLMSRRLRRTSGMLVDYLKG